METRQQVSLPSITWLLIFATILSITNIICKTRNGCMETRMAHSYANLFMGIIWWRLIDHIFMIWTLREKHLKILIAGYLNSIHPSIKFTHEYSSSLHQTIPFLDVQVHLINNHIQTNLHTKPTDKHRYLLKRSCHPNHIKKAIPFSLFLRIRCICSTDTFRLWPTKPRNHRVPYQTWL